MTTEEEIAYLKGRVDALSQLCSFLVAKHADGDSVAKMYMLKAEKDLNKPGLAEIAHSYASGYASLTPNLESAWKAFGKDKDAES